MNIVVIRVFELEQFPPAISLTQALLDLGHRVTLIASGVSKLPDAILKCDRLSTLELGVRGSRLRNLKHLVDDRKIIRDYLHAHRDTIDCVWTTTDISARTVGDTLLDFRYVMQLSELVEYVPLLKSSDSKLHYQNIVKLARKANCVVVPEYNRAHIQQAWWGLDETPFVLPNKPYPDGGTGVGMIPTALRSTLESDNRKKLLYQGVFTADRSLEEYARAVELLGDDYALYIMGKAIDNGVDWDGKLSSITDRVVNLGFVPAPSHLDVTPYGHIGLLPYKPAKFSHYSILNALYCAPNKIWEYSRFGLPMIGSDVPGLTYAFHNGGMGITTKGSPEEIADAVRAIDADYDGYSARSRAYYDSLDVKEIVSKILQEAVR